MSKIDKWTTLLAYGQLYLPACSSTMSAHPHQPHCHTTPRVLTPMCCPAGDVYYFCGSRMQYCTCTHRWSLAGWAKAGALWAFVLCTTLGVQRLLIEVVLQGLLPGE